MTPVPDPDASCSVCGAHAWGPFGDDPRHHLVRCRACGLARRAAASPADSRAGAPGPAVPDLAPAMGGAFVALRWDGGALVPLNGVPGAGARFPRLDCVDALGRADDPARAAAALAGMAAPGALIRVAEPDLGHWRRADLLPEARSHWFVARTLTRLLDAHGIRLVRRRRFLLRPVIDLLARRD